MIYSRHRSLIGFALLVATLTVWVFWLRAPALDVTLWNVDESIHAAAARTLLEGGVMYRDAVDQRTPLTYYAFAAIFGIAGVNNLFAVRLVIAAMIIATAIGLFLLGRRTRGPGTGLWAAFIYVAFASFLFYPADTHAAHTEWFVALFTTAAAVVFLSASGTPRFGRSLVSGALLGLAFLSKQPALTDIGAPLGTLLYLALLRAAPWREVIRSAAGVLVGVVAAVAPVIFALFTAGAGRDFVFYTWTYNVQFYGPEIGWSERLLSAQPLFAAVAENYPLLLIAVLLSGLLLLLRVAQFRYSEHQYRDRRTECFLLLWCVTSLVGAMSSGRGYHHYFFQCLPPFAWLAALLPGWLSDYVRTTRPIARRAAAALLLLGFAVSALWTPLNARKVTLPPPDPALPVAEFIRTHSTPDDEIFVWGYNPDIYLYADRAPASRFFYCTFQTGLIPWTNDAPGVDTTYAIVPGAMEELLAELTRNRPAFIVDCGVGPHRRFSKYPLAKFTQLAAFVSTHYVEVDPASFLLRGFRLFIARDRETPNPTGAENTPLHPLPTVGAPPGSGTVVASAVSPEPLLQRLAVEINGVEAVAVRFPPATSMKFVFEIPADTPSPRKVRTVADWADGTRTVSEPITVESHPLTATQEQASEFALTRVSGTVPASGVRALLAPNASVADGQRFFNLHAPSALRYALPPGVNAVRGRFGIQPGAYAPENPSPTDGAVFVIRWTSPDGRTQVLLEKWLRPLSQSPEREAQRFHIPLGQSIVGGLLEFEISPGPDGIMASDWTYWSDLVLELSP